MYRNFNPTISNELRTLWFHQGVTGWFFTVHKDKDLIFQSPEYPERVRVVELGIEYLDSLHVLDYLLRKETQRG
jgi:hypothetical protein